MSYVLRVRVLTLLAVLVASPWFAGAAAAQDGRLQIPDLSHLAKAASEAVDITLDDSLLKVAAGFMSDDDEAELKQLLNDVRGIYVRSYEFDKDAAYSQADVESVRSQLAKSGWARLVNVKSVKDASHAEVYMFTANGTPGGIAIVVAEPRELTIVNIVGRIDLARLRKLGGSFGIPEMK